MDSLCDSVKDETCVPHLLMKDDDLNHRINEALAPVQQEILQKVSMIFSGSWMVSKLWTLLLLDMHRVKIICIVTVSIDINVSFVRLC